MIELIYKCDLCDEKTQDTACCKVYFTSGNKPRFVHKGSEEWHKTSNGRIVCYSCMKIIKATSLPQLNEVSDD